MMAATIDWKQSKLWVQRKFRQCHYWWITISLLRPSGTCSLLCSRCEVVSNGDGLPSFFFDQLPNWLRQFKHLPALQTTRSTQEEAQSVHPGAYHKVIRYPSALSSENVQPTLHRFISCHSDGMCSHFRHKSSTIADQMTEVRPMVDERVLLDDSLRPMWTFFRFNGLLPDFCHRQQKTRLRYFIHAMIIFLAALLLINYLIIKTASLYYLNHRSRREIFIIMSGTISSLFALYFLRHYLKFGDEFSQLFNDWRAVEVQTSDLSSNQYWTK